MFIGYTIVCLRIRGGGAHESTRARETSSPTGKGSDSAGLNHFHADYNHLKLNSNNLKMDWGKIQNRMLERRQRKNYAGVPQPLLTVSCF